MYRLLEQPRRLLYYRLLLFHLPLPSCVFLYFCEYVFVLLVVFNFNWSCKVVICFILRIHSLLSKLARGFIAYSRRLSFSGISFAELNYFHSIYTYNSLMAQLAAAICHYGHIINASFLFVIGAKTLHCWRHPFLAIVIIVQMDLIV